MSSVCCFRLKQHNASWTAGWLRKWLNLRGSVGWHLRWCDNYLPVVITYKMLEQHVCSTDLPYIPPRIDFILSVPELSYPLINNAAPVLLAVFGWDRRKMYGKLHHVGEGGIRPLKMPVTATYYQLKVAKPGRRSPEASRWMISV